MFARIGHALLIVALLAATGTHWLALQSVAWTTMLADNLRVTSWGQAVERTFDGRHPCCLCTEIAKGKQAEKKSEFPLELKKLEFSYNRTVFVFSAPTQFWKLSARNYFTSSVAHAPPTPPPRSVAVS